MRMVLIAYNESLDEEVNELLERCVGARTAYTKWTKVQGCGEKSEPHMLSHIWPKANNVLITAVSEEQAGRILDGVRELRKTLGHEGVKAFAWRVDEVT